MDRDRVRNRITALCQMAALVMVTAALVAQLCGPGSVTTQGQPPESTPPQPPKLSRTQKKEARESLTRRYLLLSEAEGLGEERRQRLDAIAAELGL